MNIPTRNRIQFQMAGLIPFFLTFSFVLVFGMASPAESHFNQRLRDSQPNAMLMPRTEQVWNIQDTARRLRALAKTAKGMAAVEKLLTGAKKVKTDSMNYRSFKKNGNYKVALADFNSVKPRVKKPNPNRIVYGRPKSIGSALVGSVGDVRLILMRNGDNFSNGAPVLEIRPALDPLYTRIEYKKLSEN